MYPEGPTVAVISIAALRVDQGSTLASDVDHLEWERQSLNQPVITFNGTQGTVVARSVYEY